MYVIVTNTHRQGNGWLRAAFPFNPEKGPLALLPPRPLQSHRECSGVTQTSVLRGADPHTPEARGQAESSAGRAFSLARPAPSRRPLELLRGGRGSVADLIFSASPGSRGQESAPLADGSALSPASRIPGRL